MNATPLSSCFSAHQRLIHLYRPISTDPVSLGTNHASAQLVQQLKSSFVAANAELSLKLKGRHAGGLCRHQMRSPEPRMQRRSRRMHDGACRQRNLVAAVPTPKHPCPRHHPLSVIVNAASLARKTAGPSNHLEIGGARALVGKHPLKFKQRRWVVNRHGDQTPPVVGWCVNRIGMVRLTNYRELYFRQQRHRPKKCG